MVRIVRPRSASPLATPPTPEPAVLLDLGARAAEWLGRPALRPFRVVTAEPPVGDPARRSDEPERGHRLHARPERLPFADGRFAAVVVAGVLEHARDDLETLDELARVLRPGGVLLLRTPRAGPLTWLDPFNLYRYASDATGRGPRPFESGELGWRRHYRGDELSSLLAERGLVAGEAGGAGFGLAPAIVLLVLLVCRLVLGSARAEAAARRLLHPVIRAEANLPAGRFGYDLVIRAVRTADTPDTAQRTRR